jgi:hypothetical protein
MDPAYLDDKNITKVAASFSENSFILLSDFLRKDLSQSIETAILNEDEYCGFDDSTQSILAHGTGEHGGWKTRGPPHKSRYCIIADPQTAGRTSAAGYLSRLQDTLFSSLAFRSWLHLVCTYTPQRYSSEARRFRPGFDYTLATAEQDESRLDVVLNLTIATEVWESGAWGGWEVCFS